MLRVPFPTPEFKYVLRVNLTDESVKKELIPENIVEMFLGGEGIAAWIYWNEILPKVKGKSAFDLSNKIVIVTGCLTGVAPGSGRVIISAKSPQSYPEGYTISSIGGEFGLELRYAGFDALVIEGKAEKPVYLWIKDGHAELRDAKHLWGLGVFKAQENIKKELGEENANIITIGPAGEKLVRFASIIHRSGHAAGQGGFGAVMGYKNLKAIAVRGTKRALPVKNPERLIELAEKVKSIATPLGATTDNAFFSSSLKELNIPVLAPTEFLPIIKKYLVRATGCATCPKPCHALLNVPEVGVGEVSCVQYFYSWFQYAKGVINEDFFLAKQLADDLGLNVYELYQIIPFILILYERGVLKDEFIRDYPGSEFIKQLYKKIVERKGIWDKVAEGAWRLAEHLNMLNEYLNMEEEIAEKVGAFAGAGGYGAGNRGYVGHYDPRDYIVIGLLWATSHRDPMSFSHEYVSVVHWSGIEDLDKQKEIAKVAWHSEESVHAIGFPSYSEAEAKAAILIQHRSVLKNMLGLCDWIYPIVCTPATKSWIGDLELEAKIYSAVVGHEVTSDDLLHIAERVFTLERLIMIAEGTVGDNLPPRYFNKSNYWTGSPPIDKEKWSELLKMYYRLRGWDEKGIPTMSKLKELGLDKYIPKSILEELGIS